jgi:hypothetical protein
MPSDVRFRGLKEDVFLGNWITPLFLRFWRDRQFLYDHYKNLAPGSFIFLKIQAY